MAPPNIYMPKPGSNPAEPVVSLYEYASGRAQYTATGRSLSLAFPREYYQYPADFGGGAQEIISIAYDLKTKQPISADSHTNPNLAADIHSRQIELTLYNAGKFRAVTAEDISKRRGIIGIAPITSRPDLTKLGSQRCGFDVYTNSFQPNPEAKAQVEFGDVFAQRLLRGNDQLVISCSRDKKADGYPLCGMNAEYRGWRMTLFYSQQHLCQSADIRSAAAEMLDKHLVAETQRAPGFVGQEY